MIHDLSKHAELKCNINYKILRDTQIHYNDNTVTSSEIFDAYDIMDQLNHHPIYQMKSSEGFLDD